MESDPFAAKLRALRRRKNVSCARVSELCGLNKDAVRRYERGEARPGLDALLALADYFDVTLDQLVGRNDPPFH